MGIYYSPLFGELNPGSKVIHPETGERYGGTDWSSPDKRAECQVVDLRIENPAEGYTAYAWEIVDDPLNPGQKLKRAIPLRTVLPPEGYNASGWETIDDPLNPGGKLKQPTGLTEIILSGPTSDQQARINDKGWRPKNVLFYYGYPNSFNSLIHGWYNEKVAQDMATYDIVVLGQGVENPTHPDYANTLIILSRIYDINPEMCLFGYVDCADSLANVKTAVDRWDTLLARGIFLDQAGYDFGTNRADFNTRIDYVHGKDVANIAFVNAWNPDHVLGQQNDLSYPNTTYNANGLPSKLLPSDWILLESFPVNTTSFSGTDGYETRNEWRARAEKAIGLRERYGIQLASACLIDDASPSGQALSDFAYISALMYSLEAHGTSSNLYGASTAQVTFWARPDVHILREVYEDKPAVLQSDDSDVFYRFIGRGRLQLDFSTSAQSFQIIKR